MRFFQQMFEYSGVYTVLWTTFSLISSQSTMYVVNSVSADTQSGIDGNKPFMSQDNILNVLRESPDGTPSSVLTTPTFATFPVTSVDPSTEFVISDTESWPETTEGIAVLTTIGLTILIAVLFTVIYCVCTYRGRKYKYEISVSESTLIKLCFRLGDRPQIYIKFSNVIFVSFKLLIWWKQI